MKIIFGATSFDLEKAARKTIKDKERALSKHGGAPPVGIPEHLAHFAHVCDDCSKTFWDTDEYGRAHIGCKGIRKPTGF